MRIKGLIIAHASEVELEEMFKEINVSVIHRVEFKIAIGIWRTDPWHSTHLLNRGRQRRPDAESLHVLAQIAEKERLKAEAEERERHRLDELRRVEDERTAEEFRQRRFAYELQCQQYDTQLALEKEEEETRRRLREQEEEEERREQAHRIAIYGSWNLEN
jgi:hypothetical protein